PDELLHHHLPRHFFQGAGFRRPVSDLHPLVDCHPRADRAERALFVKTGCLTMHSKNVIHLGVKEFWSLARDPMMLLLIVYAFTASIYSTASALPDSLHNAPIAIVDEDQSPLSQRIVNAFQPPLFVPPKLVSREEMDASLGAGLDI